MVAGTLMCYSVLDSKKYHFVNNINILKQIVWKTQKWNWNFIKSSGSCVIVQNNILHWIRWFKPQHYFKISLTRKFFCSTIIFCMLNFGLTHNSSLSLTLIQELCFLHYLTLHKMAGNFCGMVIFMTFLLSIAGLGVYISENVSNTHTHTPTYRAREKFYLEK